MAVLGLRFCARAFSSCSKRGPLFTAVRGPLTIAASLVAEHRLQTHRLSTCGSRAQLLHGTWDLPRPGLEPVSPALARRLSTTAPPGKPWRFSFNPECYHCFTPNWRFCPRKEEGELEDYSHPKSIVGPLSWGVAIGDERWTHQIHTEVAWSSC